MIAQCAFDIAVRHGLVVSLFLAGLLGGVSHCPGMCAPFVLAQTDNRPGLVRVNRFLLLPYHVGRMTSYIIIAVVVSFILDAAFLFSDARSIIVAPLLMAAACFFLISAFPKLGRIFPVFVRVNLTFMYRAIAPAVTKLSAYLSVMHRYF